MRVNHEARRGEILRLADALEERKAELQEAAALDAGFPLKVTGLEVDLALQHLRTMEEEMGWVEDSEPYGTVAAIFPYDAPAVMLARLGGAALLTGNRLDFSFSSQTPRCAGLMSEICSPISSLTPVLGMDNREFGNRCVEDRDIRLFFISGASAVGEAYRRNREAFDKVFFAGPGGMPAAIVFPDADVERAARFISRRAFINGGQYCTTLKKAYIHASIFDTLRDLILEHVGQLRVGDPFLTDTDIGPIRVERTRLLLENALKASSEARLLAGSMEGEKVFPFVLEMTDGAIPDLELFGPLLVLKPFEDSILAAKELTETRYGFLLAFFGSAPEGMKDLFLAHFGMVYDNPDFLFTPMRLPFGGRKASGWILERRGGEWIERDGAFLYSKELVRGKREPSP